MLYGLDCLGLARFGKEARDAFPKGYALGVFSRTFGDAMPAVKEVVRSAACKALRVQLMWSDDHGYSDKDIDTLEREAKRWEQFAKEHKSVTVYLSPFCEHNLNNPDKYLALVKKAAPSCEPVNSVWQGALSAKFINEVHGSKSAPGGRYIYSYDGSDMLASDIEAVKRKHQKALIWFGWTANFNGVPEADAKVPREKRTAWPSGKLMRSIHHIMENAEGFAGLPPNWLWESHFQGTGSGEKANKPALTAPVKEKAAALVRLNKVVSNAPYDGPSVDGRSRYCFPEWGFEIVQKHGTPLEVAIGGKVYGKVNPAFREGGYRW